MLKIRTCHANVCNLKHLAANTLLMCDVVRFREKQSDPFDFQSTAFTWDNFFYNEQQYNRSLTLESTCICINGPEEVTGGCSSSNGV